MKGPLLLALVLGAWALAACGGGERPIIPGVASVSAARDVEDGAAKQSTTITVEFDRPLKLAKSKTPLTSHFEVRAPVLTGRGGDFRRIVVARAQFAEDSERKVILEVNALVPGGSVLKVRRDTFDPKATGEIEAEIESDMSLEGVALATLSFTFGSAELIGEPVEAAGTAADRDTAAVRAALEGHLLVRGSGPETRRAALDLFDSIPVSVVPGPKARAALAGLTGTFAAPAIGAYLAGDRCGGKPASLIAFQTPPDEPRLLARVTAAEDGSRIVSLSPELEAGRFELLMPLLVHEAVHCDNRDGRYEEVAATAFDTFFYLHLLAADPTLAASRGRLAKDLAIDAVAMLNSGRRFPESAGVLKSASISQALPGSNSPTASFADFVAAAYPTIDANSSPDEPVALAYAAALASMTGMPEHSPFDLRYLDELLGRALDPEAFAGVIDALALVPGD